MSTYVYAICYIIAVMYGFVATSSTNLSYVAVEIPQTAGGLLKELRQRANLSVREAARRAGISHTRLGNIENDPGRPGLTLSTIEGLARAYDVPMKIISDIALGKLTELDPNIRPQPIEDAEHPQMNGRPAIRSRASIAVRHKMLERGLTQEQLAEQLNRSQTWISTRLLGETEKTIRRLWSSDIDLFYQVLAALDWDNDELARQTGIDLTVPYPSPNIYKDQVTLETPDISIGSIRIPVYDPVGGGPGWDDGDIIEYINIPGETPGANAGYRVRGDSMAPDIRDGSNVVIRLQNYAAPKNVIVAWLPEEGMVCKWLEEITEDGFYVLTSFNTAYKPIYTRRLNIYGIVWETRLGFTIRNGVH